MKIYIATPVNGRKEKTLEGKRAAAYRRVCEVKKILLERYPDAEVHSSFDSNIAPMDAAQLKRMYGGMPTEAQVMGKCVQCVMECDLLCLDYGWSQSRGCKTEFDVAYHYGIQRMYLE